MIALVALAFVALTAPRDAHAQSDQPKAPSASLIVWNVGQGQWVTASIDHRCLHFDTGGEFAPWKLIERACAERENAAYFSHWDWDHLSFVRDLQRRTKSLCIAARPGGTAKPQRERTIESVDECGTLNSGVVEIPHSGNIRKTRADSANNIVVVAGSFVSSTPTFANRATRKKVSSNSASRVFLFEKFLMPGDSTTSEEEFWKEDSRLEKVKVLILGHHGSKTSTSYALLKKLINARQAVASARFEKYGHPHMSVELRLRLQGIALLRTEDWGSIIFDRSPTPQLIGNAKPLRSNLHSSP